MGDDSIPQISESKVTAIENGEYMAGSLTVDEAVALYARESASYGIHSCASLCGVSVLEMVNHLQQYEVSMNNERT
jgi:hypothetical protein